MPGTDGEVVAAMTDGVPEGGAPEIGMAAESKTDVEDRSGISPDEVFGADQEGAEVLFGDEFDASGTPPETVDGDALTDDGPQDIEGAGDDESAGAGQVEGEIEIALPDGQTWKTSAKDLRAMKQNMDVFNVIDGIFNDSPTPQVALQRVGELWGVPPQQTASALPEIVDEATEFRRILSEQLEMDPKDVDQAIKDGVAEPQMVLSAKSLAASNAAKSQLARWNAEREAQSAQQQHYEKLTRNARAFEQAIDRAMTSLGADKLFQGQADLGKELKAVVSDLVFKAHYGENETPAQAARTAVTRLLKLVQNGRVTQAIAARNQRTGVKARASAVQKRRSMNDGHAAMSPESKAAILRRFGAPQFGG